MPAVRLSIVLLVGMSALVSNTALADDGVGVGETPRSAALGFVAMDDLTGQLNYVADPNGQDAGFIAHCDGYTSFKSTTSGDGFPRIVVTATCLDQDGQTVYLKAQFTDRGEPGVNDSVCILWSTQPRPPHATAFIHDHGKIQSGNIVIHEDPLLGLTVEILSTE